MLILGDQNPGLSDLDADVEVGVDALSNPKTRHLYTPCYIDVQYCTICFRTAVDVPHCAIFRHTAVSLILTPTLKLALTHYPTQRLDIYIFRVTSTCNTALFASVLLSTSRTALFSGILPSAPHCRWRAVQHENEIPDCLQCIL